MKVEGSTLETFTKVTEVDVMASLEHNFPPSERIDALHWVRNLWVGDDLRKAVWDFLRDRRGHLSRRRGLK